MRSIRLKWNKQLMRVMVALSSAIILLSFVSAQCIADSAKPDPMQFSASISSEGRAAFNMGVNFQAAGNFAAAADKYAEVLRTYPECLPALLNYADSIEKCGRIEDAVQALEAAAKIAPDHQIVLHNLGRIYLMSGRRDQAKKQFERYVWLYPDGESADYMKTAAASIQDENNNHSIFSESKGKDNYLAQALEDHPHRWSLAQIPIPVFIANGDSVPYYSRNMTALLQQALLDWSNGSQGKVSFTLVDRPEKALISCGWASDVSQLSNPIELGETQTTSAGRKLYKARITFLTKSDEKPISPREFKGVALHELGHALGLSGHSSDAGDIMFMFMNSSSAAKDTLSERDKRTILALYQLSDKEFANYNSFMPTFANSNPLQDYGVSATRDGIQNYNSGNYQEALRLFEKALQQNPRSPVCHLNLAKAYMQLGKQELKAKEFVKYQKHTELAAKQFQEAKSPVKAAEAYDSLSLFAASVHSDSQAKMYAEEAKKLKESVPQK